jgi:hypothetical protein
MSSCHLGRRLALADLRLMAGAGIAVPGLTAARVLLEGTGQVEETGQVDGAGA